MSLKDWIKKNGVPQWRVAEIVGVHEVTLCRWLRRPERLKPDVVAKIEAAVREIRAEKEAR